MEDTGNNRKNAKNFGNCLATPKQLNHENVNLPNNLNGNPRNGAAYKKKV